MSSRTLTFPLRLAQPDALAEPAHVRALAGDETAWDELFRVHNRRVVLVLLARGVRAGTARDLAQEAWMRLIEQQRRGRLQALSVPALVITQALFLARDRARRGDQRYQHISFDDLDGDAVDPEQHLFDRDRLERAGLVLAACSPSHQRVFRAMFGQPGASSAEVARATGLSVQRVRQIVCEVRKRLRAALEEPHA
jgi:RNA polymerase sigma-70 factor (ECF subfamily)